MANANEIKVAASLPPGVPKPGVQMAPIGAPPAQDKPYWQVEAENYLEANHWEKMSTNERGETTWKDPMGSVEPAKEQLAQDYKDKDGKNIKTYQHVGPVAPWNFRMADAIKIQRLRDDDAVKKLARAEAARRKEKELAGAR